MTIVFRCPQCGHGLNAPDAAANKVAACPKCRYDIAVPRESEPVKAVVRRGAVSRAEQEPPGFDVLTLEQPEPRLKPGPHSSGLMQLTTAVCPRCFTRIPLEDPATGQLVRCLKCQFDFRADATPVVQFAAAEPEVPIVPPAGRVFTDAPFAPPSNTSGTIALWIIAVSVAVLSSPIWLPILLFALLVIFGGLMLLFGMFLALVG